MSRKDVEDYYNQIYATKVEWEKEMQDWAQQLSNGLIDPEIVQNAQKTYNSIKVNYERAAYFMYLLNKPVNKKKRVKYDKQFQKQIADYKESKATTQDIVVENKEAISELKELKK